MNNVLHSVLLDWQGTHVEERPRIFQTASYRDREAIARGNLGRVLARLRG
jgi:hypothetical protein